MSDETVRDKSKGTISKIREKISYLPRGKWTRFAFRIYGIDPFVTVFSALLR